ALHEELAGIVARHEGAESAALFRFWCRRGAVVRVARSGNNVLGVAMILELERVSKEDARHDPGVEQVHEIIAREGGVGPVRYMRFVMSREHYQAPSPEHSALGVAETAALLATKDPSFVFSCHAAPEFWAAAIPGGGFRHFPQLDFRVADRRYGLIGCDLRGMDLGAWFASMTPAPHAG